MMNHLYELFCMGAAPPVSADELKRANFQQFMTKTLVSAKYVMGDEHLRQEAIIRAKTLLGQKSHSIQNTVRTIKMMFDAAKGACEFNHERTMVGWLEECVTLAVLCCDGDDRLAVPDTYDRIGASEVSDEGEIIAAAPPKKTAATAKNRRKQQPRQIQSSPRRRPKPRDSDEEYRPSEDDDDDDDEEEDDDATVPILEEAKGDQALVPEKGSKKKNNTNNNTKKKKPPTQAAKKNQGPEVTTFIAPGAGTQAVVKYFTRPQDAALKQGYFCRSYFFPGKESFNAFLSVLGSAKITLDVCIYSLTDDTTADCLIAAKKRGVDIRIITDDAQAASKYADATRLQRDYGIPYKDDNSPSYMHNKFAVIDGKVLINGSFNWSRNARFKNRENIMITNIPEAVKQFQDEFEKLWKLF
ncbi:hypothetical protein BX666DRAFT_2132141 [Dichotomocladium elegans]|nr:hypothetical protein BX666DRAFT_2132141 [Dichotomocladium elegans]